MLLYRSLQSRPIRGFLASLFQFIEATQGCMTCLPPAGARKSNSASCSLNKLKKLSRKCYSVSSQSLQYSKIPFRGSILFLTHCKFRIKSLSGALTPIFLCLVHYYTNPNDFIFERHSFFICLLFSLQQYLQPPEPCRTLFLFLIFSRFQYILCKLQCVL